MRIILSGFDLVIVSIVIFIILEIRGKCFMTSTNPIIDKLSICSIMCIPSCFMLSPPWPINEELGFIIFMALISFPPCRSPEGSPAIIKYFLSPAFIRALF